MKLGRVGHFFLSALASVATVALEQLGHPADAVGHVVAFTPLAAAAFKWAHYELKRLAGGTSKEP